MGLVLLIPLILVLVGIPLAICLFWGTLVSQQSLSAAGAAIVPDAMTNCLEPRFGKHVHDEGPEGPVDPVPMDEVLARLSDDDVDAGRYLDRAHPSYIREFGVWMPFGAGGKRRVRVSRDMVLTCYECRKSGRDRPYEVSPA